MAMAIAHAMPIHRARGQYAAAMIASDTCSEGKQCSGTSKSQSAPNAALSTGGRAMVVGWKMKIAHEISVAMAIGT